MVCTRASEFHADGIDLCFLLAGVASTVGSTSEFRHKVMVAYAYKNSAQNINPVADTIIFDGVAFDTANMWSNLHPERLTAPLTGFYQIGCTAGLTGSTAGTWRALNFIVNNNGTECYGNNGTPPTSFFQQQITTHWMLHLNKNDFVRCDAYQDSGGPVPLTGAGKYHAHLQMYYIGE